MPLILAIEPDRKQASKIAALAKNPLHAELVIGESAEAALATLGHRMPDLILTSLLLSPKDDAVLTDRLREMDAAGAHVPTLVIPVLGSSSRGSSVASGLLTRLRKSKVDDSSLEGCDPAMFAAQITEYLERAALEREAHADRLEARSYRETAPAPVAAPPDLAEFYAPSEPEPVPVAAAVIDEQPAPQPDFYEPTPYVETAVAAAPAEPEPIEWTRTEPEWRAEPQPVEVQQQVEDAEPHIEASTPVEDDEPAAPPQIHVWERDGDASRPRLIRVPDEDLIEEFTFDTKPAATSRPSLQPGDSPQKVVRNTLMAELTDLDPPPRELAVIEDPDTSADLAVESATWEKFEAPVPPPIFERIATRSAKGGAGHARSSVKRVRVENDTTAVDEMRWTVTTEITTDPELADFVTALETLKPRKGDKLPEPATVRKAIAPEPEPAKVSGRSKKRDDAPPAVPMGPQAAWPALETTAQVPVAVPPAVAPELPGNGDEKSASGDAADKGRKARPKKKRDAQDEWGMFDPEQCGISAVMAKLDEIKDTD